MLSEFWTHFPRLAPLRGRQHGQDASGAVPGGGGYLLALLFVALAGVLSLVYEHLVARPDVTLVFVLAVVVSAAAFGWGPALAAALAGVLTFDYFFTRPYHSLRIDSPSDLAAAGLLLVIAAVVSSVAAEARRQARTAQEAAAHAKALEQVAAKVLQGRPEWEVMQAAAEAASRVFDAPSVVLLQRGESLAAVASSGPAQLTGAEREAAVAALQEEIAVHGGVYPFERSEFDFWPLAARGELAWGLGVGFGRAQARRPAAADPFLHLLRGYLAAAIAASPAAEDAHG
ncbi:MAG: DUF4118 domain-containing protein [Alphaproteobacteria bacterium]|nr:DUF4118 domain-containing protein [Alphaproteobacteria bacterium]